MARGCSEISVVGQAMFSENQASGFRTGCVVQLTALAALSPKAPDAAKRMKVGFCRSEKSVTKSKLDSPRSYWPKKYRPRL